jgi:hypothetical protein
MERVGTSNYKTVGNGSEDEMCTRTEGDEAS